MGKSDTGLGTFHLARGIGMVLILLGHSLNPFFPKTGVPEGLFSGAGSVLGGGIMAMFFLISGHSFYVRSPKKCVTTQTKLLLKPYLICAGGILATKLLLSLLLGRPFWENGGELVLTYLLGLNAEGGGHWGPIPIESVSILWFILALYGGWILYNGICRLSGPRLRSVLILVCVIGSYVMTVITKIWPFCLPMMLLSVGYLAVGHQIRQRDLLERKLPVWGWGILIGICLLCAAFGGVNMVACYWKLGLLDVVGSYCVGFLLLRLYRHLRIPGRPGQLLETVGCCSVWIVFLHGYEKVIFPWHRLSGLFPQSPALCAALCFLGRCVLIYVLYRSLIKKRWKRRKKTVVIQP